MWLFNLGWPPGAHADVLSLPFLNSMGEENQMKKFVGQDKDRKITYLLHHGQNRLNLEKINFIYCQLKIAQISKKQIKTKDTFYDSHLPLFPGSPSLPRSCILYLFPSPRSLGTQKMGVTLSS